MTKIIKILNVLIACEESQAECMAFRNLGHNAYSCDVQKCSSKGHPEWHICGDVTPLLQGEPSFVTQDGVQHQVTRWDLIVAHPPCTYLSKLGRIHLFKRINPKDDIPDGFKFISSNFSDNYNLIMNLKRYELMQKAREFFYSCLNTNSADYVAVENPVPMRIANLPKPSCYINPFWYGVKYSKKTCYWLRNLPPLMPQIINPNYRCYTNCSSGKYRSRTFPQVAQAIAEQWSEFIINDR